MSPDESTPSTEPDAPWSQPAVAAPVPAQQPVEPPGEAKRTDGRDAKGHWVKGQTGNPTGGAKPEKTGSLVKILDGLVDRSELGKMLWSLATGKDRHGRAYKRPNLSVQLAAVTYIYDRLEGKPLMQLRHEGDALAGIIILHPGRMEPGELVEGEAKELSAPEDEDAHIDLDVNRAQSE